MKQLTILTALLLMTSITTQAWDDGYRAFQDVAPEYLEIRVNKVDIQQGGALFSSNSRIIISADVTQVFRSTSGLQPGNTITIAFTRKSEAGPGTQAPAIPKEGSNVPAFLKKKGNAYEPAAVHHSFEPLTPQQLMVLSKTGQDKPKAAQVLPPVVEARSAEPKPEPKPEPKAEKPEPIKAIAVVPKAEPVPTPEPVIEAPVKKEPKTAKAEKKPKPRVTQPIIVTEPSSTSQESKPKVAVIDAPLPDRPKEPTPQSEPVKPVVVAETPKPTTPAPEPIVIKEVETAKPAPTTPRPPVPAEVSQTPAAVAPPAPASGPFDQDGLAAYSRIYAKIKEGDRAMETNDKSAAEKIYKDTLVDLENLKASKPDFQPFIVEYRQRDLIRKLKALSE